MHNASIGIDLSKVDGERLGAPWQAPPSSAGTGRPSAGVFDRGDDVKRILEGLNVPAMLRGVQIGRNHAIFLYKGGATFRGDLSARIRSNQEPCGSEEPRV